MLKEKTQIKNVCFVDIFNFYSQAMITLLNGVKIPLLVGLKKIDLFVIILKMVMKSRYMDI